MGSTAKAGITIISVAKIAFFIPLSPPENSFARSGRPGQVRRPSLVVTITAACLFPELWHYSLVVCHEGQKGYRARRNRARYFLRFVYDSSLAGSPRTLYSALFVSSAPICSTTPQHIIRSCD